MHGLDRLLCEDGDPGHLTVETSLNLMSWTELAAFLSTSGTFVYTEEASGANQRFYRVRFSP